jgi:hypothetical protein
MYWYNPKTRSEEMSPTPEEDEEAYSLPEGDLNSEAFIREYEELRADGGSSRP